jgi:hypothetical protein
VNTVRVKITGSEELHAAFSRDCSLTEGLFAKTLAMRLETAPKEDWMTHIQAWFESVRWMSVGTWVSSGIKTELLRDGQPAAPTNPLRWRVEKDGHIVAAFDNEAAAHAWVPMYFGSGSGYEVKEEAQ